MSQETLEIVTNALKFNYNAFVTEQLERAEKDPESRWLYADNIKRFAAEIERAMIELQSTK